MINIHEEIPLNRGSFKNPVITIGFFDGVHLGHRKIIKTLRQRAEQVGGETFIITFKDHPGSFLSPENPFPLIGTTEERIAEFEKIGVDHVVLLDMDEKFFNITAGEFFHELLVKRLGVAEIIIGYDHCFGKNREGNYLYLKEVCPSNNMGVTRVEEMLNKGEIVSSTLIRKMLQAGDMERVSELLGRRFSLSGRIIHGKGLGHKLGSPTANIESHENRKIVPPFGVYAVMAFLDNGEPRKGVMNIGNNPTFEGKGKSMEVHLLDFLGDLYGKNIRVDFVKKIRDEIKFSHAQSLSARISKDIEETRAILS